MNFSLALDVDLNQVAQRTPGYSGADLENVCKEAALYAMTTSGLEHVSQVTGKDFEQVLQTFSPSLNADMLKDYQGLTF